MPDVWNQKVKLGYRDWDEQQKPPSKPKDELQEFMDDAERKMFLKAITSEDSLNWKEEYLERTGYEDFSPEKIIELKGQGLAPLFDDPEPNPSASSYGIVPTPDDYSFFDLNQPDPRASLADLGYDYIF